MILACHTEFDLMAEYDPVRGGFEVFSRRVNPQRVPRQLSGLFDRISQNLVLLFRHVGILFLDIGGLRLTMSDHAVHLDHLGGLRVLRILANGKIVFELPYDAPIIDPPLSQDPTPFVDEEDFDFALFLRNLSQDPARQARIFGPDPLP
jgi:hypothetical protein